MATVYLPTPFGALTLEIKDVESARHFHDAPRRNFTAKLGAFAVNGKPYGRLAYDFYIELGKTSIRYLDWRVYSANDNRATMTDKGHSKVRDAVEAAVLAYLGTEEAQGVLARADAEQRAALVEKCNNRVKALQEEIAKVQALAVEAQNSAIPANEVEDKLRRI